MKKTGFLSLLLVLSLSVFAGCNRNKADDTVIVVGASPSPHAEILKAAAPVLEEKGYQLQVKEFTDYILPNTALNDGDLLANYFQHQPYLDDFNAENKTELASVCTVHIEPMGIYAGKASDLTALKEGDVIALPNDPTNETRALQLLEAQGLITLDPEAGAKATVHDITGNPKNLEFQELEAAQIPRSLPDVAVGVINGNYALDAGLSFGDALVIESSDTNYANIVAVQAGKEQDARVKALVEALHSDTVRQYIAEHFPDGSVIPSF